MRPLPNVIQLTHSFDSVASTVFSLEDLNVSERIFRFPATSGWLLPETTLRFFPAQGRHAPPSLTSARLNVITTALSTTLPALSRVTYTPCFCFPLFATLLLFGMTVPEPNECRQLDTFPRLRSCTPKLPCILHPPCFLCGRSPLVVFAPSTAAYTFRFAYRTVFSVFCVCCFVLARVPRFFCVSVLAKLSTPIFPWRGILI